VRILDSLTLKDECPPHNFARDAITKIIFSHNSEYFATAVSVLGWVCLGTNVYVLGKGVGVNGGGGGGKGVAEQV
jgi:S-adenosylhomocysteine hydrolase